MREYGGVKGHLRSFLTSVLDGCQWLAPENAPRHPPDNSLDVLDKREGRKSYLIAQNKYVWQLGARA